jgi:hypothetical protein
VKDTLPIAVAAVGVGLAMVGTIAPALLSGITNRRWECTQGQICGTGSPVGEPAYIPPDRFIAWATTPVLQYEYTVNGRQYVGTQVNAVGFASHRAARRAAARYPEGQVVDVWYQPSDPSRAVLEPGVTAGGVIWAVVSVALLGLSILALVHAV